MGAARHAANCDWHTDQYPWECSCGAGATVEERMSTILARAQAERHLLESTRHLTTQELTDLAGKILTGAWRD